MDKSNKKLLIDLKGNIPTIALIAMDRVLSIWKVRVDYLQDHPQQVSKRRKRHKPLLRKYPEGQLSGFCARTLSIEIVSSGPG
jgi:hypothetical protein